MKCENYFNTFNSMTQFMLHSLAAEQFWVGVLQQLTSQLTQHGMCLDIWLMVLVLLRILPLHAFPKESALPPPPSPKLVTAGVPGAFCFASKVLWLSLPLRGDSLRSSFLRLAAQILELYHAGAVPTLSEIGLSLALAFGYFCCDYKI